MPHTRETDTTSLTWEQIGAIFRLLDERDRIIVSIEGVAGPRPSELFAFRRRSRQGTRLKITETIYRGEVRKYGKTKGSVDTVELPKKLADDLRAWLDKQQDRGPEAFMFPNTRGGFISAANYLRRIFYPVKEKLGLPKLNFQVLRRSFSTLAQCQGCTPN